MSHPLSQRLPQGFCKQLIVQTYRTRRFVVNSVWVSEKTFETHGCAAMSTMLSCFSEFCLTSLITPFDYSNTEDEIIE